MKSISLLLLIGSLMSVSSHAYMTHEQIVKRLTSQEGEKTTKKGKVLFLPREEVLSHKKKKKSKKYEQRSALRRAETPTPSPTVIPEASPSPSPVESKNGVDLRSRDTGVKSQVGPYCTAYALAAALENKVGDHVSLSQAHVWSFYRQYSVEAAFLSVPGNKITTEEKWPNMQRNPYSGYMEAAKHKITKMVAIDTDKVQTDIDEVKKELDQGNPVYMGLQVPGDMASCFATVRPSTRITSGGHAVLVVGYRTDLAIDGNGYFIIRNSWGKDCGDEGYQYMPFSVCSKRGMYCYFYSVKEAI